MAQVLTASSPPSPHDSPPRSLRHTPSPQPPFRIDTSTLSDPIRPKPVYEDRGSDIFQNSRDSSISSSPRLERASADSTPPSSISLDKGSDDDEELFFPIYDDPNAPKTYETSNNPVKSQHDELVRTPSTRRPESTAATPTTPSSPEFESRAVADDLNVREEPSHQVDYLSHDWREEDIWSSWRYIVSRRKEFGEKSRLENASWRTWAKAKYKLKTVSPETLNWLKDCDVTWLYGPLKEAPSRTNRSAPVSHISKSNSFLNKRPILKKRSVSEVMLQKSLSSSSLVKQAATAVQAQRSSVRRQSDNGPSLSRTPSESRFNANESNPNTSMDVESPPPSAISSGSQTPDPMGRRHIRFDDKVEQCIAVDFKQSVVDEEGTFDSTFDEEESSDDGLVMMKPNSRRSSSNLSSRRESFGSESNGIAKLPCTTLKYHEQPDCPGHPDSPSISASRPRLQSNASQETLRPSDPSTNFLIDEDDDADMSWEPSGAFGRTGRETPRPSTPHPLADNDGVGERTSNGLRRTPSGMFMPFDEDEDQSLASTGMLGRVVDTVNTARDIIHVVWNVGWRS